MTVSLDQAKPRTAFPIPALIKRNIALFALSQSFTGAGMQFAYGLGALILGTSLSFDSAALFVIGMIVFAMGMYGAQQLRVAATDMVLPHMRGQALGYIATGSLVGLVISPLVVYGAEYWAPRLDMNPLSLPWFFLPV